MENKNRRLLQLFAEGAEGASPTGENGAAAGHEGGQAQPAPRMTWEQVKADPEYSGHMQEMVRDRLKKVKQAGEDMEILRPALSAMARVYGLDPEQPDYGALAAAVTGDRRYSQDDSFLRSHYDGLATQAQQLKEKFPDFDLNKELQDPAFVRLTSPEAGVSLEDAYYTLHRREIQHSAMEAVAQQTAARISNAIRSGTARPVENGTSAPTATVTALDYRSADPAQRKALKARIRQAAARGEKLYPGV